MTKGKDSNKKKTKKQKQNTKSKERYMMKWKSVIRK